MKMLLSIALLICGSVGTAYGAEREPELSVDLGGGVMMEMALIHAGSFLMGDARGERDEKLHQLPANDEHLPPAHMKIV